MLEQRAKGFPISAASATAVALGRGGKIVAISLNCSDIDSKVRLYTPLGQEVSSQCGITSTFNAIEINISPLKNGNYFIKTEYGSKLISKVSK